MNIDFLQIALFFLIVLLAVFLTITGFQVFLILRDLKKTLDKFNEVIQTGETIAKDIEKPITAASKIVTSKLPTPKQRRFYKKIMK